MRKSLVATATLLMAGLVAACGQTAGTATPITAPVASAVAGAPTAAAHAAGTVAAAVPSAAAGAVTAVAGAPTTAAHAAGTVAAAVPSAAAGAVTAVAGVPTTIAQMDDSKCATPEVLCVGLVTDVGEVDDKSFNQSAWEAVKKAKTDLSAVVNYVETKDAKDYGANIGLFTEKKYDVIVTVGFALGEATAMAATENPTVKFIGVDQLQAKPLPNLAGLVFNEDKAGFLAGALAAQMSTKNKIAAVLGTDLVPPVVAFKVGYENGAKYVNPNIQVISTYHPGGLDTAFTDPKWGGDTAKLAIDQGADVIFGAGGKTGNGALIETAGNKGVLCIGVDSDQWETVPEAHPCLLSSAMKLITPGITDLLKKFKDGSFPSGNYYGSVGLAPFHDFETQVPQQIKDNLAELSKGLGDGTIKTGYTPAN